MIIMKRIISVFLVAALCMSAAFAQGKKDGRKGDEGRTEKMKAEMVGFITTQVDLTAAEAEKFWPVYNEAKDKQMEAFGAAHKAFKDLSKAIEEGGKGADVKALTDAYINAQSTSNAIFAEYLPKFREVLPEEKVAKLYLAEEKFRRQQIHNLRPSGRDGGRQEAEGGKGHRDGRGQRNKD